MTVAYARALGAEAIRIETIEDLHDAATRDRRGPVLLDIPIDGSVCGPNPREGTCNFPRKDRA
jgi:thiamine pyrophosphate-dependent acetolactate synthase large subunit-like protein